MVGFRGMVVLAAGALAAFIFAGEALGATGQFQSMAVLSGPTARGTATFVAYPGHGEINLRIQGLARDRNPVYLAWIADAKGDGLIGGVFPRTRGRGFAGSLIVPGPRKEGIGKVNRAERLVITQVPRQRALRVLDAAQRSNWREPLPIKGELVAKGRAEPFG